MITWFFDFLSLLILWFFATLILWFHNTAILWFYVTLILLILCFLSSLLFCFFAYLIFWFLAQLSSVDWFNDDRRTVNSTRPMLDCSNGDNCTINKETRKRCQSCRFDVSTKSIISWLHFFKIRISEFNYVTKNQKTMN